ncbi:MAG TPA: tetratricopeptide repeat protein [Pyrinomonadaceae bacterium]|jgi:tetratricopeptide (TPR) repeat protein|nr:tetratricopeptide repeat protein [Pyrinomonadaceae bacterium]
MQKLRIFAASTSDTAAERSKVAAVAAALKPLADHLDIALDVIDWRSVVPGMGRPEQVILEQLDPTDWNVFLGILWHRFGTPPGGSDAETRREYLSGTEEEFKTAYRLWKEHGRPRVMMYRCTRAIPPEALDPDQFKLVREFFEEFEAVGGEHPGLYQTFDTPESFERLLLDNLQRLLLDYGEQIKGSPIEPQVVQEFAPKVPNNLPRRTSFFGRDKEMKVVMRALSPEDRTWGVLIDGIGGIGKTSLATEAAHRCDESRLFEAFVFVSAKQNALAPGGIREQTPAARTLDEFLNETARVLDRADIPKLAADARRHELLEALRERPTLLVYDNLETLTKEEQEAMADFLRELPQGCKAVITSRRRGGEGSVWLRLEKLDRDAARQIIEAEAERAAGLKAKLARATEARWQELYDATGGSPLALSHTLGLMRVRASLNFDAALEMLRGNPDADLQRFIFQEARNELTTNDAAALRALSFFTPSATLEAWAEVSQLSRIALETTIDRLSALSLVDVLPDGEDRYDLHPLTRNFVRGELLADAQVAHETEMRFANYWVAYAQRYGGWGENYKTFHFFEAEWANLDASAERLWQIAEVRSDRIGDENAARKMNNLVSVLCSADGPLFYLGRWDQSLQLSKYAHEAMCVLPDWSEAGWRAHEVAWIYYKRSRLDEAGYWADRCTEAWAHGGSKHEQATGTRLRGLVAQQREDYDTAERLLQDALTSWRDLKNDSWLASVLNSLGNLERRREHYDAAERYYREVLELCEKLESKERMTVYGSLGLLALDRERWAEAREWFEKELSLARGIGRQDLIAHAQSGLARVHEAEQQPAFALPLAQEALAVYERLYHRDLPATRKLVERLKKKIGEQEAPAQ